MWFLQARPAKILRRTLSRPPGVPKQRPACGQREASPAALPPGTHRGQRGLRKQPSTSEGELTMAKRGLIISAIAGVTVVGLLISAAISANSQQDSAATESTTKEAGSNCSSGGCCPLTKAAASLFAGDCGNEAKQVAHEKKSAKSGCGGCPATEVNLVGSSPESGKRVDPATACGSKPADAVATDLAKAANRACQTGAASACGQNVCPSEKTAPSNVTTASFETEGKNPPSCAGMAPPCSKQKCPASDSSENVVATAGQPEVEKPACCGGDACPMNAQKLADSAEAKAGPMAATE